MTIIGVAHRDPTGFGKLTRVFERLTPRAISIELSPLSLAFRLRSGPLLKQRLYDNVDRLADELKMDVQTILDKGFVREILAQIDLPFEYASAMVYGAASGAPAIPIDSSFHAKTKLTSFQSLISLHNLRILIAEPDFSLERKTEAEYARARMALQSGRGVEDLLVGWSAEQREEWVAREKIMARRIGRIVSWVGRRGGGQVVHVGGWLHCAGEGLAGELRDFHPAVEVLDGSNP